MFALLKIAFRNIKAAKRRSILIGIVIFFATFLLFAVNSIVDGIAVQIVKNFINIQTGHVAVMWNNVMDIGNDNYMRLYMSLADKDKGSENEAAINNLNDYLKKDSRIDRFVPVVFRLVKAAMPDGLLNMYAYGLSTADNDYLIKIKSIELKEGNSGLDNNGAYISSSVSVKYNVRVGDMLTLTTTTFEGANNTVDIVLAGIYKTKSPWDDYNIYIADDVLRDTLMVDGSYFNFTKIFLKNPLLAKTVARDTNAAINNKLLVAEPYNKVSTFIVNFADNNRAFFNVFNIFIVLVIILGVSGIMRVSLLARLRELGALRAIGYSSKSIFGLVTAETFLISIFSLACSFFAYVLFVIIGSAVGFHVPPGPVTMVLGGEEFAPIFSLGTIFLGILETLVIGVFATFNIALMISSNQITNILNDRPVHHGLFSIISSFFKRGGKNEKNN